MKAVLLLALAVAGMMAKGADQRLPTKEEIEKMTPQERKAAVMAIALRKYGGPVTRSGSGEGVIKVVNAQKDVSIDALYLWLVY